MKKGVFAAVFAYAMWGLFPIYWKLLHSVPALQLLGHRIVWSFVFLTIVMVLTRDWRAFIGNAASPRVLLIYAAASALLGVNWFVYVWAVNAGFVVETSLGYFINPLISVALGVVFLHERLRVGQWAAIALAAFGVAYLAITHGSLPWIALVLAFTFATYGLVKKVAPLGSIHGLALETAILFLPAAIYLGWMTARGAAAFPSSSALVDVLVVGAGVATMVPLLLFSTAAKRIPLYWIGMFQYMAPTIQFALGVFVYHEALSIDRLVGFGIVWAAVGVFIVEGIVTHRLQPLPAEGE